MTRILTPPRARGLLLALLALAACHDESHHGGSSGAPAFTAAIAADRVSGSPGTTFHLEAVVGGAGSGSLHFLWDFGDGTGATGPEVEELEAVTLLVVFDVDAPVGLFGEALPALPGDLDGDGELELRDAQLLRPHLAGLAPLVDAGAVRRADLDRDGRGWCSVRWSS